MCTLYGMKEEGYGAYKERYADPFKKSKYYSTEMKWWGKEIGMEYNYLEYKE